MQGLLLISKLRHPPHAWTRRARWSGTPACDHWSSPLLLSSLILGWRGWRGHQALRSNVLLFCRARLQPLASERNGPRRRFERLSDPLLVRTLHRVAHCCGTRMTTCEQIADGSALLVVATRVHLGPRRCHDAQPRRPVRPQQCSRTAYLRPRSSLSSTAALRDQPLAPARITSVALGAVPSVHRHCPRWAEGPPRRSAACRAARYPCSERAGVAGNYGRSKFGWPGIKWWF